MTQHACEPSCNTTETNGDGCTLVSLNGWPTSEGEKCWARPDDNVALANEDFEAWMKSTPQQPCNQPVASSIGLCWRHYRVMVLGRGDG